MDQDDYFKLRGKVVLITGASSGIGAGTAVEFAKRGSRLALTGRDESRLQVTVRDCVNVGLPKDQIHTCTGDLTREEDVKRIVDSTVEKFGTVHVLVNNAGYAHGCFVPMNQATAKMMRDQYEIHVVAPMNLTHRALPELIKNKGAVVNVSSMAGNRTCHRAGPYGTCKAAQEHMTRMFSNDPALQGVRFSSVSPGVINTPVLGLLFADCFKPHGVTRTPEQEAECKKVLADYTRAHPMSRHGEAEEVGRAIVFLASDASSFITGVDLPITGGLHNTTTIYNA